MLESPADRSLVEAMTAVEQVFVTGDPDPWAGSPYAWIRRLQTRTRGKAGEEIVDRWLRRCGYDVRRAPSAEADRLLNGQPAEIKLSTVWGGRDFRFSQIRDQDYRALILLGVEPTRLHVWCVPKAVAFANSTGQHTGGSASETRWTGFPAAQVPDWLRPYGGSAAEGLRAIALQFPPPRTELPAEGSNLG